MKIQVVIGTCLEDNKRSEFVSILDNCRPEIQSKKIVVDMMNDYRVAEEEIPNTK